MKAVAKTHVGMVRKKNEDSYYIDNENQEVYIVADGMGGHLSGEVASSMAVEFATNLMKEKINSVSKAEPEEIIGLIIEVVNKTNEAVYRKSFDDEKFDGMGTTLVMLVNYDQNLYIAHIGDSRAYIIKDDYIKQITKDHTLVQALVDSNSITMEEARVHPQRNVLIRALGTNLTTKVDVFKIEEINTDTILLMCTDGLTGYIEDEEIGRILNLNGIDKGSELLIDLANNRGGQDNITLLLIQFTDEASGGKN